MFKLFSKKKKIQLILIFLIVIDIAMLKEATKKFLMIGSFYLI